eukprot:gnl/Dysnectes_brevis/3602_a4585_898.p1 GENE.gnl/Dysnectes_brevis/3602_a4585_898~~gnl/Dysnectes_brevis/3602_a4585_898.p1  ORF type:complete len:435 (+),score=89.12 gnl/Dysnectes_brevis/3602_a4585_898:247-1551(+)
MPRYEPLEKEETTNFKRAHLFLISTGSLTAASQQLFSSSLPFLEDAFPDATQDQVSCVLTLPSLFLGLSAPIFGWKSGGKPFSYRAFLLLVCIIGFIVTGIAPFFCSSLKIILIWRCLFGVCCGGVEAISNAIISLLDSPSSIFGVRCSNLAISGLVLNVLGGALCDTFGYNSVFLVHGLAALTLPALAYLRHLEPKPKPSDQDLELQTGANPRGTQYTPRYIAQLAAPLLSTTLIQAAYYSLAAELPFLLSDRGFTKGWMAGLATGTSLATAGFLSALTGPLLFRIRGWLTQRYGREPPIAHPHMVLQMICCMPLALGLLLIGTCDFLQAYWTTILLLAMAGFGIGPAMPNVNAWSGGIARPGNRSVMMGFTSSLTFLAHFMTPLIFGWAKPHWGLTSYEMPFVLATGAIVIVFFGSLLGLRYGPSRKDKHQE